MDLQTMLKSYCKTMGLSCYGCEIAPKIGARPGVHDGTCERLAEQEPDKVLPFLQKWYENQPFIPRKYDLYFFVDEHGGTSMRCFDETACAYGHIISKNCFRTTIAAIAHRNEILAKYNAIDDGRWPD